MESRMEPRSARMQQRAFSRSLALAISAIGDRESSALLARRNDSTLARQHAHVKRMRDEDGSRDARGQLRAERERAGRSRSAAAGRFQDGVLLERQQVQRLQAIALATGRIRGGRSLS